MDRAPDDRAGVNPSATYTNYAEAHWGNEPPGLGRIRELSVWIHPYADMVCAPNHRKGEPNVILSELQS